MVCVKINKTNHYMFNYLEMDQSFETKYDFISNEGVLNVTSFTAIFLPHNIVFLENGTNSSTLMVFSTFNKTVVA